MGCEVCDAIFEKNMQRKDMAFTRVGNGTVLIGACDKHFNQLVGRSESSIVYRYSE